MFSVGRLILFILLGVGTCLLPSYVLAQPAPRRIQIVPQKGPLAGETVYTNSYALLVGINRYASLPKEDWMETGLYGVRSPERKCLA